jgi:hypothetical protein
MFGLGSNKRRMRNDTFSGGRLRNAALAGLGMLAWKWWRNRQTTGSTTSSRERSWQDSSTRSGDTI